MSTIARLTIEQYDRMIASGVFETGLLRQRIELIDGELREMSPIGPQHEDGVVVLTKWSVKNAPEELVSVRIQLSIGIPTLDSAPEPDVAWVKQRRYMRSRPKSSDVFLIIEVADSSLEYDRGEKAHLYAAAGIKDYWIVNVIEECVEVYREPKNGRYRQLETCRAPGRVRPLAFPKLALPLELLFSAADRDA
jgi:Uma2 family endonuclease